LGGAGAWLLLDEGDEKARVGLGVVPGGAFVLGSF